MFFARKVESVLYLLGASLLMFANAVIDKGQSGRLPLSLWTKLNFVFLETEKYTQQK